MTFELNSQTNTPRLAEILSKAKGNVSQCHLLFIAMALCFIGKDIKEEEPLPHCCVAPSHFVADFFPIYRVCAEWAASGL